MPATPRSADVIGKPMKVMRIATTIETLPADYGKDPAIKALGKSGRGAGGKDDAGAKVGDR